MTPDLPFDHPMAHGFARLAVAVPRNRVADPAYNGRETVRMYREAAAEGAVLVAFPELGLSAYTCDDLFHQDALLEGCEAALREVVEASRDVQTIAVVGLPLRVDHRLFNCAAVVARGKVLGVLPKTYLPNYGEFYEGRQFSAADSALATEIELCGMRVPFGADMLFKARDFPLLTFHVEICEDLWVPIPPSSYAALAGATVLVNLSASNIVIGKADYRRKLIDLQSARCLAAYLYSSAGIGESTTDLAWDGQSLIYEGGEMLAESARFSNDSHLISADADLARMAHERMRQNSFGVSAQRHSATLRTWRTIDFDLSPASIPSPGGLRRTVERFPYVPADPATLDERCREVFNIQVQALVQRLQASNIGKVVIGVSGGLDSTHALMVCAQAMDRLKRPRSDILGYTMPGFATSGRTLQQAHQLMTAIGCTAKEIDIRPSCRQMLEDLGHPFADGKPQYDITFENVQAGERTSHLFRLANHNGAIVIGTGDLSELALGWCTYGVGDHMSHYNVNASVPKTLIKHLVHWVAEAGILDAAGSETLRAVVATEVSPELVPSDAEQEQPSQKTEDTIGPYELQDFHLYYIVRFGFRPSKVAFLAHAAWHDRTLGRWPDMLNGEHNAYSLDGIRRHLHTFLYRFFKTSQFKRSCVPNGPKVGSGGSLSPRGDWRAPSDSEAEIWLADLARIPDGR